MSRGRSLGGMALLSPSPCEETALSLAQAIGTQIGVMLKNALRYEQVKEAADHDFVTGLLNHRAFFKRLEQEFSRARRSGEKLSAVVMDVDAFKLFNDTYGHPVGDQVLRTVSSALLIKAGAAT